MEKAVDWLIEDGGFAFIVCCVAIGFCVAVAVSKKVRSKFF